MSTALVSTATASVLMGREAPSPRPEFGAGSMACGHMGGGRGGRGENPVAGVGWATCGGPAPPGPPTQ